MKKVVIYARYSSDMQSEFSVEDQFRIATERAMREGWEVVGQFADRAISGASIVLRPGIQDLMQAVSRKDVDIVMAESLDRLSRDQEDIAAIYKRLKFAGIQMFTLSEGEINEMHIGLKGTMNALFLVDLGKKVHRGQRGRIEHGLSSGGIAYGYDVVKKFDGKGDPVRGERTINEFEAKIVVRIFEEYALGRSPKAIAKSLNAEGIPSPSRGQWSPSTINGNRKRGLGLLNNDSYNGELSWNRVHYIKDPSTGKRVVRINDESEIIRKQVPELRIVSSELWEKVKDRQGDIKTNNTDLWKNRRPKTLFSGLVECACCGGGMTKSSRETYTCFSAFEKGTCTNKSRVKVIDVERMVFAELQHRLLDPQACQVFCDEYVRYMAILRKENLSKRTSYEAELKKRERDDERMIQMVIDGFAESSTMLPRVKANSARIRELQGLLADEQEIPPLLHPAMATYYRKQVGELIRAFDNPGERERVVPSLRNLVKKIVIHPADEKNEIFADLYGDLAGILSVATGKAKASEEILTMAAQVHTLTGTDSSGPQIPYYPAVGNWDSIGGAVERN